MNQESWKNTTTNSNNQQQQTTSKKQTKKQIIRNKKKQRTANRYKQQRTTTINKQFQTTNNYHINAATTTTTTMTTMTSHIHNIITHKMTTVRNKPLSLIIKTKNKTVYQDISGLLCIAAAKHHSITTSPHWHVTSQHLWLTKSWHHRFKSP